MKKPNMNHVRSLRKNTTNAENHLWYYLRAKRFNGYKFRRQHLIHPYVVDFVCLNRKIIIECDGGQHLEQQEYDKKRQIFLEEQGYKIIRFWNDMVLKETSLVLEIIFELLELSPPLPRPSPPSKAMEERGIAGQKLNPFA